jgi:hypothetical protein
VVARGEVDDDALNTAMQNIVSQVPAASQTQIMSSSFQNCLTFTVMSTNMLASQGYISAVVHEFFTAN